MEAASTAESSANFYQTARRSVPEDSRLHSCSCRLCPANHVGDAFARTQKNAVAADFRGFPESLQANGTLLLIMTGKLSVAFPSGSQSAALSSLKCRT
jgi:hypothetical protein